MISFLFTNFLESERTYHAAKAYWSKKLGEFKDSYQPYLSDRFANGRLFYDGNPIFNIANFNTGKGVRIVQESHEENGEIYHSFVNEIDIQTKLGKVVSEKVIVLTLTPATANRAKDEIEAWLDNKSKDNRV